MTFATAVFLFVATVFFTYWIYKAVILLRALPQEPKKMGLQLELHPENDSIKKVLEVDICNAVKIMVENKFS